MLPCVKDYDVDDDDDDDDGDDDDDDDNEDDDSDGDVATVIYVLLAQQFRKVTIIACHVVTQYQFSSLFIYYR